jgi:aminoglycoside phosphotransferase
MLHPDPAVPQRDLLLDPQLVGARLSELLGPVDECTQTRVKYRIGRRLRVVHRIRSRGVPYDVAASTFPTLERSERAYLAGLERSVPCGPMAPVTHDRELRTVFWTLPNDRKLDQLPALAAPAPELAESLAPAWRESTLVAYAPEKAATVRCADRAGQTIGYAKGYAAEEGERTQRVHEALAAALPAGDRHLRLPRSLGYSPEHRTLLVEAVGGAPLLAGRDLAAGYRRLGRALARLHDLPAPDALRFRRVDDDRLDTAAELIGSVRPDVAEVAHVLAARLRSRREPDDRQVCLHGDVNFRNALVQNGRVALIDLDQVARGPVAADLGSVLAALDYAGVVGLLPARTVPSLRNAFLGGYTELAHLPTASALCWHEAAALLAERALRVVTRVRPEGLARLRVLLSRAERTLG